MKSHVALALTVTMLASCTVVQTPPTASGGLPTVLAAESFLADIAQNVAGERLHVDSLLPAGADPHSFAMVPADAVRLERAQVLIINGLKYEGWLDAALQSGAGGRTLIVATDGLSARQGDPGEHPEGDPHMWMSPRRVVRYVENIREGLSMTDPGGAAVYGANAEAYIAQLEELEAWILGEVNRIPEERRLLVTNHDALGYFADDYGLTVVGQIIPGISSAGAPSARDVARLIDSIRSTGAPAIFLDTSENQQLADQIALDAGVAVITGLYIETLSRADGPAATYLEMIRFDVTTIVNALT